MKNHVNAFRKAIEAVWGKPFETVPFIAAFLAVARGLSDAPVHYPRPSPADGVPAPAPKGSGDENFRWFVRNKADGSRKPLPLATNGHTHLPYLAARAPENNQGGGHDRHRGPGSVHRR